MQSKYEWINRIFNPYASEFQDLRKQYDALMKNVSSAEGAIAAMEIQFREGGIINFADMQQYEISTEEKPMPYPTGKYCLTYRLPAEKEDELLFYVKSVAPEGEMASYGIHKHMDCDETVLQLTGKGKSNGKEIGQFGVIHVPAGEWHDYFLDPGASLLVPFKRVKI